LVGSTPKGVTCYSQARSAGTNNRRAEGPTNRRRVSADQPEGQRPDKPEEAQPPTNRSGVSRD